MSHSAEAVRSLSIRYEAFNGIASLQNILPIFHLPSF